MAYSYSFIGERNISTCFARLSHAVRDVTVVCRLSLLTNWAPQLTWGCFGPSGSWDPSSLCPAYQVSLWLEKKKWVMRLSIVWDFFFIYYYFFNIDRFELSSHYISYWKLKYMKAPLPQPFPSKWYFHGNCWQSAECSYRIQN